MTAVRRLVGTALCAVCALALGATAVGAQWEVTLEGDGTFRLSYDGAPIARSGYVSWGPQWKWTSTDLRLAAQSGELRRYAGRIAAGQALPADVELEVDAQVTSGNQLTYTVTTAAPVPLEGIIGFCVSINFSAAAGAFGYRPSLTYDYPDGRRHTFEMPAQPAAEVIEPDVEGLRFAPKTGFAWHLPGGQAVTVRFDRPIQTSLQRDMEMRLWYASGSLAAGRQSLALTFTFPEGTRLAQSVRERMGPAQPEGWLSGALQWDKSPVDLSFLNDKPAGRHGFLQVRDDEFAFEDGTPARFWGGNLAAYALFSDKSLMEQQAERIARLGFNLMRIHHHDSTAWVSPTVIDRNQPHSQALDAQGMDRLDYLIHCLKRQGVYVFLDLHVGRQFRPGDAVPGFADLDHENRGAGEAKGFCYYNSRIEQLMQDFSNRYLSHANPYTGLAYKDDPAVVAVLLTNENDLTSHFGNAMLGDKGNPFHNALFEQRVQQYCDQTGLPYERTRRTWEPGPSKRYLNYEEARWFSSMAQHLRAIGLRVPVTGTQSWATMGMWDLPALAEMDFMSVNSYGDEEPYALGVNPRYGSNFVIRTVAAQVADRPLAITEWHTPWPIPWRAVSPLYVASVGCLQGWDAPMLYNYSQDGFGQPSRPATWTTYYEPAVMGAMPAAALAFRRGYFRPAELTVAIKLSPEQVYDQALSDENMLALRTLAEQHRVTIELEEEEPGEIRADQVVTDPAASFLPAGAESVLSDTGEVGRDWRAGVQTFNSPCIQGAQGFIGRVALRDVEMEVATPFGVLVAASLDGLPLERSARILITAIGRAEAPAGQLPFRSEPIVAKLRIRNLNAGMRLVPLGPGGEALSSLAPPRTGTVYEVALSAEGRTHWYLLAAP